MGGDLAALLVLAVVMSDSLPLCATMFWYTDWSCVVVSLNSQFS